MNKIIELNPDDVLDAFSGGTEVLVTEKQNISVIPGSKIRHENALYLVESVLQGRRKRLLLKLSKIKENI